MKRFIILARNKQHESGLEIKAYNIRSYERATERLEQFRAYQKADMENRKKYEVGMFPTEKIMWIQEVEMPEVEKPY